MSKKSKESNIIDFKKASLKKFNEENEIVFTIEGEDYQLGEMVHQASNDNGVEFVFKLEEFDDEEDSTTIH
tara:strand:+ start:445 stop:657 length:213 start_codon:yes stop_codon:yes gene_type:complete